MVSAEARLRKALNRPFKSVLPPPAPGATAQDAGGTGTGGLRGRSTGAVAEGGFPASVRGARLLPGLSPAPGSHHADISGPRGRPPIWARPAPAPAPPPPS